MKIITPEMCKGTERDVDCPSGAFKSLRMLLEKDGMGYTVTHTTITPGDTYRWHYKNHLESCYCMKGYARLTDVKTGKVYIITPGVMYVLDKHDEHEFHADIETELLCVFNPPLTGQEVHLEDGSYASK